MKRVVFLPILSGGILLTTVVALVLSEARTASTTVALLMALLVVTLVLAALYVSATLKKWVVSGVIRAAFRFETNRIVPDQRHVRDVLDTRVKVMQRQKSATNSPTFGTVDSLHDAVFEMKADVAAITDHGYDSVQEDIVTSLKDDLNEWARTLSTLRNNLVQEESGTDSSSRIRESKPDDLDKKTRMVVERIIYETGGEDVDRTIHQLFIGISFLSVVIGLSTIFRLSSTATAYKVIVILLATGLVTYYLS